MDKTSNDHKLGWVALGTGMVSPILATSLPVAWAALPLWVVAAVAFPTAAFFFKRAGQG